MRYQLNSLQQNLLGEATLEIYLKKDSQLKLEIKGPFGNKMGKFIWKRDSTWILSTSNENESIQGQGNVVSLAPLIREPIRMPEFLYFLVGLTPPSSQCTIHQKSVCRIAGTQIFFSPNKKGSIEVVNLSDRVLLEIGKSKIFSGYLIPEKIRLVDSKPLILMHLKHLVLNPHWKKDPFF